MKDRVLRVLPALLHQPGLAAARVLDEAVPVRVAGSIHPVERRVDVRPQALDEGEVAGALEVRVASITKSGVASAVP